MMATPSPSVPARTPTAWTAVVAVVALGCSLLIALVAPLALAAGVPGAVLLAVGVSKRRRRLADGGAALLAVAVVGAALTAEAVLVAPLAAVAAIVAWDLGRSAIDVGERLGASVETDRLLVATVTSSVAFGVVAAGIASTVFLFVAGAGSVGAIVLLVLSGIAFAVALGRDS